jgi:hypothetical protein
VRASNSRSARRCLPRHVSRRRAARRPCLTPRLPAPSNRARPAGVHRYHADAAAPAHLDDLISPMIRCVVIRGSCSRASRLYAGIIGIRVDRTGAFTLWARFLVPAIFRGEC